MTGPEASGRSSGAGTHDPGKQSRLASGIPVVSAFDGYRAYAVFGVVLVHIFIVSGVLPRASGDPIGVIAWGTVGQMLDMLFIISGFVIFLPTVARNGDFGSTGAFAIRRAARLLPAYWLVLSIMLVLIALVPVTPPIPFPSVFEIGLNFTTLEVPADFFRQTFFLGFGINRAIWTLHSEVCFYVLLPFVALWYYRHPFLGLGITAAITVAWKVAVNNLDAISSVFGMHPSPETLSNLINAADIQFPAWIFSIGLGMTSAWLFVHLRKQPPDLLARQALWVQGISLIGLAVFAYLAGKRSTSSLFLVAPEYARHSVLVTIGLSASLATFMLATAIGRPHLQRPFTNSAARWVADYSVGIYMFHLVIITYVAKLLSPPQDGTLRALAVWCALVLPSTILYGWLSGRFLEQPVRRRAQRRAKRLSRARALERSPTGSPASSATAERSP